MNKLMCDVSAIPNTAAEQLLWFRKLMFSCNSLSDILSFERAIHHVFGSADPDVVGCEKTKEQEHQVLLDISSMIVSHSSLPGDQVKKWVHLLLDRNFSFWCSQEKGTHTSLVMLNSLPEPVLRQRINTAIVSGHIDGRAALAAIKVFVSSVHMNKVVDVAESFSASARQKIEKLYLNETKALIKEIVEASAGWTARLPSNADLSVEKMQRISCLFPLASPDVFDGMVAQIGRCWVPNLATSLQFFAQDIPTCPSHQSLLALCQQHHVPLTPWFAALALREEMLNELPAISPSNRPKKI